MSTVQCCMCGKKGLSTVEGNGGPECELSDGRWVCSFDCWEIAVEAPKEESLWRFWNEKAKAYLAERDSLKALCDEMAKENERLRVSLREKFCPRPCNGRPANFDVGDCVDAGECGCESEIASYRKEKEVGYER